MIAVIGDYMEDQDILYETVRRSPEGDFPIVKYLGSETRPGGAGAVVAMIRGLGDDATAVFSDKRICIKQRTFIDGQQVFRADFDETGPISDAEARTLVDRIPPEAIVLVADYGKGTVTDALWEMLRERCETIIVDPSRQRQLSYYAGATGIVPNRAEARVDSVAQAISRAEQLRDIYWLVCVKLDRDGMVVASPSGHDYLPAECPDPVDVCGAGDMVLAGIGVGLLRGMSWFEACRFANTLAGLKCLQRGATPLNLDRLTKSCDTNANT